jgi:ketosteroid isomerase-like protein
MRKLFIAFFAMALLPACGNKITPAAEEKTYKLDEVKLFIDSANKVYGNRFKTNDTAYYAATYCKDAVIMPGQMSQVSGRDGIRNFNYDEGKNKDFKVEITATSVYGGPDAVIEEGYYTYPGDDGVIYDRGKFIAIWKQEEGKWKLYREIWNTDNAPTK